MRLSIARRLIQYRIHAAVTSLVVLALVFGGIAAVLRTATLGRLDLAATRELQESQTLLLRNAMFGASFFGNSATLAAVVLAVAAYLHRRGLRRAAGFVVLSLIGLPADMLLKAIWNRPRPDETLVDVLLPRSGYSFPSGHAMGSTVVYGFLAFLAWVYLRNRRYRKRSTFLLMALPPIVSLSRIYVGAHWLSDVIAGMTAGLFILICMGLAFGKVQELHPEAAESMSHSDASGKKPDGTDETANS